MKIRNKTRRGRREKRPNKFVVLYDDVCYMYISCCIVWLWFQSLSSPRRQWHDLLSDFLWLTQNPCLLTVIISLHHYTFICKYFCNSIWMHCNAISSFNIDFNTRGNVYRLLELKQIYLAFVETSIHHSMLHSNFLITKSFFLR